MRSKRALPATVVVSMTSLVFVAAACSTVIGIKTYNDDAPPDAQGSNVQMDGESAAPDATMILTDGGEAESPDATSVTGRDAEQEGDDASQGDDAGELTDASFPGTSDAMVTDAGCPPSSYCALVLASSPSFYFRFDDLTAINQVPLDWSGHHATMAWTMPASLGSAAPLVGGTTGLRLGTTSGTSETGAGFTVFDADGGQAPLLTGVAPFTLEFWYDLDPLATAEQYVFATFAGAAPSYTGYRFFLNSTKGSALPIVELELCHGTCASNLQPMTARGSYQHIAATYDGATIIVYVNGNHAGSTGDVKGISPNTKHPTSTELFGTIDELAIYPTALSAAVISRHASFPN